MPKTDFQIFNGAVIPGFRFASGSAVGRQVSPSPFAAGTLKMQEPHFRARGFSMQDQIADLVWATINVRLAESLLIDQPDVTMEHVDWTTGSGSIKIPPETFCFAQCVLAH